MKPDIKKSYELEIKFQQKMLHNLQRWFRVTFILSSCAVALLCFGSVLNNIIFIVTIIILVIAVIGMIILGLGIKNGRRNLLQVIEKYNSDSNKTI